jgi:hypothetical protein
MSLLDAFEPCTRRDTSDYGIDAPIMDGPYGDEADHLTRMQSAPITDGPCVAITRMIGMAVTDTRTLRMGILTGPVRWIRGQLFADVRMTDTDRIRRIRTDVMQLTPRYPSPITRRRYRDTES